MSSESRVITLSEVSKSVDYGYTASATTIDTGFKFLRITDIQNGFVEWQSVPFCKIDQALAPKYRLESGDIVVARTGNSTGENYLYDSEEKSIFASYLIRFRIDKSIAEPGYVWRCMRSPSWWDFVNGAKTGSAQAGANAKVLGSFKFELRSLPEQKTIAHILGTLDDKIELNRKTNETLEEIAKALFKSWFVDFDPVRAKAEGRPTGLPAEISDLFPDSFEKSELGEIPRGWEVKPIGDVADCVGGSTPSTDEPSYWEGGKHWWATPKDLSSLSEPFLLGTARKITDAGLSEISSGVLPPGTVLLSSRAPVGYLVVATIPVSINQGFIALRPNKRASSVFLLNWCFNNLQQIKDRSSGTTFAEISKAAFRPIQCVLPPAPLIEAITQTIQPLYDRVVESMRESSSLSSMRDTLLPKLISGELRVSDAEALVAEAGL